MKIKNNSNKIINVGVLQLLPGKTEELPTEYENHPVLEMLKRQKSISLINSAVKAENPEDEEEEQTPAQDPAQEAEVTEASLKKLTNEKLIEICTEKGLSTEGVKADLVARILEAQE